MKKIKIKFTSPYKHFWAKFTPNNSFLFDNCEFYLNNDNVDFDFWFVFNTFEGKLQAVCIPDNIILITGEPETVIQYHHAYIKQFSGVFTTQSFIEHQNKIKRQLLPWLVNKSYDELKGTQSCSKTKLLSVICSDKDFTTGHKYRNVFLKLLKEEFGCDIDIFGKGINEINDKWDAIYPYKYHIVLENSEIKDYWTEKLADAYLGFAYPLYWGCPNIAEYFSETSFLQIDIKNPDDAIAKIKSAVEQNYYEKFYEEIIKARNLVLDKYNIFSQIAEFANKNIDYNSEKQLIKLKSEWEFNKWKYFKDNFRRRPFKYGFKILKEGLNSANTPPV